MTHNIIDNDLKAIQYKYQKNEKTGTYLPNKSWYDLKNNLDLWTWLVELKILFRCLQMFLM